MIEYRHITHRAIDLRGRATGSGLALRGQFCLRRLTQNTFSRGQETHALEVLRNRLNPFATEPRDCKDILDPLGVGFMIPAPALPCLKPRGGVPPGIEQVGAEPFPFATRETHFK
jgi:hypothetical protein